MLTLADLLAAGGRLHGPAHARSFTDVSYDSRLTGPGELFLALRTARADGHDFIADALAAGATGVLCAEAPRIEVTGATVLVASDPAETLRSWAAARVLQVAPRTIGVTGSVGKTTTKRAIATVLEGLGPTFASRRSFNSLLGLPVALARLEAHHRFAVLEYGADRLGEIARLAALFPPQIAVVTTIGEAHLAAFGTPAGAAREKSALVAALPPDGLAILNGDDPLALETCQATTAQVVIYGQSDRCALRAEGLRFDRDGTHMRMVWHGQRVDAFVPLLGEPGVYAALAAVAVGIGCGMQLEQAAARLAHIHPADGRLRPLPARGGAMLLDDTYSGAPPAMRAALHTLAALPARRRIAVLGDMEAEHSRAAEVGRGEVTSPLPTSAAQSYAGLGTLAARSADLLIWKGDGGAEAVRAAQRERPGITAHVVHTAAGALEALPRDLGPGDLILVKGGAAARMELVAAGVLDPQLAAGDVLVRQEQAWRSVRIGAPDRPTWVRVDLDAISGNVRRLRELAGVPLIAVLKADAYGHGAVRVGRAALAAGAAMLAVATLGEARVLREAGIAAPILVLGYTPPWQARDVALLRVAATIFDLDTAHALAETSVALGRTVRVHVKIDTGMARLGLPPQEAVPFLQAVGRLREAAGAALEVEGLYTHFATADSADEAFAREQLDRFCHMLAELEVRGLRPPLVHAANSAAVLRFPAARFDLVRSGIALYGLQPASETPLPEGFRPALSLHSEVAQVRELPAGAPVSYGASYRTPRPARIATVPAGYADGLRRSPPWQAMLVRGRRAPVVGRITMDYAMLDVTDIAGVRRGDPVVLIGRQGDAGITAEEVAGWLGTINYEVTSTILPRVPREVE
jgi:alanine racemase